MRKSAWLGQRLPKTTQYLISPIACIGVFRRLLPAIGRSTP